MIESRHGRLYLHARCRYHKRVQGLLTSRIVVLLNINDDGVII